ncbi:glycosyltransferase family 4 protein [[Limnothrix rosea] IAM M-220]|uniref:glycosyltransferase family 4 protein n=1 Tax=[Limnothrix rosea] IAM M-220 TaxID=454133 RepID=UPI00096609D1|nr:glycosyltransferase family 4 protein [[Limnothrix rosea] IAM M-220]OKH17250.1 glycosyl transferase [[Limnothrix rosea] IAM M-220]
MKVLQINSCDVSGGASIAGYRLHQGLHKKGVDSKILVGQKQGDDRHVNQINKRRYINKALSRISASFGLHYLSIPDTWQIKKHAFYQTADILNLHNLHGEYFNYLALSALTADIPAVYTLHDMWSFTGHCAYSFNCERWQSGCGNCPNLNTYPAVKIDNTYFEWRLKKWIYEKSNLTIVTPSQWLKKQTEKSILHKKKIYYIPNGIPTNVFQPLDAQVCRNVLDLPQDKYILAVAAQNLKDYRKGSDLLQDALKQLPKSLKKEICLLILGSQSESFGEDLDIQKISLGYVSGDRLKAIFYSAADLFICPTRADNLPLVLQEAMACGVPLVSFNVGGVPELVRPEITGYLANPENSEDLCKGIVQLLKDKTLRKQISQHCRHIAETEYSIELQAQRYIELYQQILQKRITT